jgi:hypothetical protein
MMILYKDGEEEEKDISFCLGNLGTRLRRDNIVVDCGLGDSQS